jgi:hypothetical protein
VLSGVIRSCRVQPSWRSEAIRVPVEIIATIVPNEVRPTM